MHDEVETRVAPKNWREYLRDMRKTVGVMHWVWKEFVGKESRRWLRWTMVALFVCMIFSTAGAWFLKDIVDGLMSANGKAVVWGIVAYALFRLAHEAFAIAYMWCREGVFSGNMVQLDTTIMGLYLGKSSGQHNAEGSELCATSLDKARTRILESENMLLFDGFRVMAEILFSLVCLMIVAYQAGIICIIMIIHYIAWMFFLNRKIIEHCAPIDKRYSEINHRRGEMAENVERVKTNGKERESVEWIAKNLQENCAKDITFWRWFILMIGVRGSVNIILTVSILGFGAWKVWHGEWSVGFLLPMYSWAYMFGENLWMLGWIEQRINWNMPSILANKERLSVPCDIIDKPDAQDVDDERPLEIEFRGVSYGYAQKAKANGNGMAQKNPEVIQNVSFKIPPRKKIALIGPSGVGKTTMNRLLLRYYDPTEGSILVNGVDLRDIRLESWVKHIAYIAQRAQVFDGSIRFNLLYGIPEDEQSNYDDPYLWSVMAQLGIDFGDRLAEKGLDTLVGKSGIQLSGGEQQRLMIAAAIIRVLRAKEKLVIMDETTSNLDAPTENAVRRGIFQLLHKDASALMISHRLSTVLECDWFVVLKRASSLAPEETQVEAQAATPQELWKISPSFRELAKEQGISFGGEVQIRSSL